MLRRAVQPGRRSPDHRPLAVKARARVAGAGDNPQFVREHGLTLHIASSQQCSHEPLAPSADRAFVSAAPQAEAFDLFTATGAADHEPLSTRPRDLAGARLVAHHRSCERDLERDRVALRR